MPKPILPELKRDATSAPWRTNPMPKGTCHERIISRMRSHGQILDEVSQRCERIRLHMMRHLPSVISMALSRNPLESWEFWDQRVRDVSCIRFHVVRHLPDPFGDRLSVRQLCNWSTRRAKPWNSPISPHNFVWEAVRKLISNKSIP